MTRTTDSVALNDWQSIGASKDITPGSPRVSQLLGQAFIARRDKDGQVTALALYADGKHGEPIKVREEYGHVFLALGDTPRPLLKMPEFDEPGRRLITCGVITVKASPLRIVENFLDMGHFPFVHTNILGAEPDTEVAPYDTQIRTDVDEVWATNCKFFQPQAAMSATGGITIEYEYRVTSPFITILYKTCPARDDAWDLIGLFVQPLTATHCDVHAFMLLYDDTSTDVDLIHFQQMIFLQDRPILENQRPALLPLTPGAEHPVSGDRMSSTYRRWLRERGLRFGALVDVNQCDESNEAGTVGPKK
ncbi:MAG: phenylpropionate dioxygenase-like ring-hydroxylating dioxygenase large terminal subunit [Gammaproteobacteria bacterium]|jgi:phenylpropionate dioxygenase-like ring-hydroxylating dioxygenase large terminal subunit